MGARNRDKERRGGWWDEEGGKKRERAGSASLPEHSSPSVWSDAETCGRNPSALHTNAARGTVNEIQQEQDGNISYQLQLFHPE